MSLRTHSQSHELPNTDTVQTLHYPHPTSPSDTTLSNSTTTPHHVMGGERGQTSLALFTTPTASQRNSDSVLTPPRLPPPNFSPWRFSTSDRQS
ncbi:unnamed protein product [Dicrocoelium dendriticum]|nr:unnamed protein product [Dicrocoelium dendriticum]